MKQTNSYRILQFSFPELYGLSRVTEGGQPSLTIRRDELRELLYAMVPASQRGRVSVRSSVEETAKEAASAIPYNAALRQIYLKKEHVDELPAQSDDPDILTKGALLRRAQYGPSAQDADGRAHADTFYYLRDLIYIDLGELGANRDSLEQLINGLTLYFAENDPVRFVLFERSASQLRSNMLVMIREGLHAEIAGAVSCGIPENQEVTLAKYAAYRALLMTSGLCINTRVSTGAGKAFDFIGRDSVIVVKDYQLKDWVSFCKKHGVRFPESLDVTSATVDFDKDPQQKRYTNIRQAESRSSAGDDKLFDGEGLISEPFAAHIVSQIAEKPDSAQTKAISSFQVRMPFVKGVLHRCDFHAMLRELYGEQDAESLVIRDAFGQVRRIRDVHMILTVSMFKMFAAFFRAEAADGSRSEKMHLYWDAYFRHHHRLFVSNCDESMRRRSVQTITNYQFLSTMEPAEAEQLIYPAVAAARAALQSRDAAAVAYLIRTNDPVMPDADEASGEQPAMTAPQDETGKQITDAQFLMRCPKLSRTAVFRERMEKNSLMQQFAYGHLFEPGLMRYLSGDLLQMTALLTEQLRVRKDRKTRWDSCPAPAETPAAQAFLQEVLGADGTLENLFYAPGAPPYPKAVIDRNPHLARQEHVIAERLEAASDSFRERYFGHLHGVVMLRVGLDRNTQRLGGADFDGDIVRLYYDSAYIRAAAGSRSLAPLLIPGAYGDTGLYNEESRKELVRRSAGSMVGQFSNAGFRSSLFAYGARTPFTDTQAYAAYAAALPEENGCPEADIRPCAERAASDIVRLSCMTGLEIDSAKSGYRPVYRKADYVISQEPAAYLAYAWSCKQDALGVQNKKTRRNSAAVKDDPYHLTFFTEYKDAVKQRGGQGAPELADLPEGMGQYSPVECLPYIFDPSGIRYQQNDAAEGVLSGTASLPEWARRYHALLWKGCTRSDKAKNAFTFAPAVDPDTAVSDPNVLLCDLTEPAAPVQTDETLFADAVLAVRAFHKITDNDFMSKPVTQNPQGSVSTAAVKSRTGLYKVLTKLLGVQSAEQYGAELEAMTRLFPERETVLSVLFQLVSWKQLSGAELRCERLRQLFQENGISYPVSGSDPLIAKLVRFDQDAGAASVLPEILRTVPDRAAFVSEGDASGTVKRIPVPAGEEENCYQLCKQLHAAGTPDALNRVADALDAPAPVGWMPYTAADFPDADARRDFLLKNGFPQTEISKPLFNLLSAPRCWQILLYFLDLAWAEAGRSRRAVSSSAYNQWLTGDALPEQLAFFGDYADQTVSAEAFAEGVRKVCALEIPPLDAAAQQTDPVQALSKLESSFDPAVPLTDSQGRLLAGYPCGDCQIPMRAVLLFCLLHTARPKLHREEKARLLIRAACGLSDRDAAVLLLERERVLRSMRKKDRPSGSGALPVDARGLERLLYRLYPGAVYELLTAEDAFRSVPDDAPDLAVGYLDGAQCAVLRSANPQRKRKNDLSVMLTAELHTVVSTAYPDEHTLQNAVKLTVPEVPGWQITLVPAVEYAAQCEAARLLRLVSLPFEIVCRRGTESVVLLRGAVSSLTLPGAEGVIAEAYRGIASPLTHTLEAELVFPTDKAPYAVKTDAAASLQRPLPQFIYGYRKYIRKEGEAQHV